MNKDAQNRSTKTPSKEIQNPVVSTTLVDLDSIIQKQGYDAGRLFHSRDKATYTFIHDDEVISLHFDLNRHDLFIKGHKITNFEAHAHLGEFLERFKKALMMERNIPKQFINAFDTAVGRLEKH